MSTEFLQLTSGERLAVSVEKAPEPLPGAPAILYLHGFASSGFGEKGDHFRARALATGFAFARLDFRGHGGSDASMAELTLSRNLEDAAALHDLLDERLDRGPGEGTTVVLGSSMGGLTAAWYGARRSDRVAAVLAIAPAFDLHRSFLDAAGPEVTERWRREGILRFEHGTGPVELGWGFIEDLQAHALEHLVEDYAVPTLVLQGREDASVPWRRAAGLVASAPRGTLELHLFADGDHRLVDRLERLWSLMVEFLVARGIVASTATDRALGSRPRRSRVGGRRDSG